jgi:hypothetical protein
MKANGKFTTFQEIACCALGYNISQGFVMTKRDLVGAMTCFWWIE